MEAAADILAEQPDQVLLAGVQAAADARAGLDHALAFQLSQAAQYRRTCRRFEQAFLDEHHRVCLVERVDRGQHRLRARTV